MKGNRRFSINNLASANPSFGEELYCQSFLVDIIDLIVASSIKDIKTDRKYMPWLFLDSFCQRETLVEKRVKLK